MSFEEKTTWVSGLVTVIVIAWYVSVVAVRLGQVPVEQVAYQWPLVLAIGAMVVLTIAGTVAMAIATAIGNAIGIELTGRGSIEDGIDRKDERDAEIDARGDRISYYVSSALMVGVLALALLELPHFWIANATFAGLVMAGLVGIAVKLVAYRRGF